MLPESATAFRALAARANHLSHDRPDLAYAAKELCREFAVPTQASLLRLKRLIRYLVRVPRLVFQYRWQKDSNGFDIHVDTDFAGCRATRRSTSGGVALRGTHCIQHWSSTQATIALSSGEAELSGLVNGATYGIGLRSLAHDLGLEFSITLKSDATAALGMARRLGVGQVRHLDTSLLWIQNKIKTQDLSVQENDGSMNAADIMTKHVDGNFLSKHIGTMSLIVESGRAETAPQITASLLVSTDDLFPGRGASGPSSAPRPPSRATCRGPPASPLDTREWAGADHRDRQLVNGEYVYKKNEHAASKEVCRDIAIMDACLYVWTLRVHPVLCHILPLFH